MGLADGGQSGTATHEREGSSLGASGSAAARPTSRPTGKCPKCGCDSNWGAASWCPECGYYPGVADGISTVVTEPAENAQAYQRPQYLPFWLKLLLGGLFAVGLISLIAKYYFYYHDGNQALWTVCQFLIGLAMVCGAQLFTTVVAIRADSDFSLLDGLSRPIEVWRPTIENLSEGYRRLCSLSWGAMAAIMAVAVIGGIDYAAIWGEPPPPRPASKPKNLPEIVGLAKSGEKEGDGQSGDLAEGLSDVEPEEKAPLPTPDRPLDCVVYGYMKDGRRDFGRLLLAAKVRGKWQHVAVIDADHVPIELRGDLANELSSLTREKPLVMGPFSGVWVEPDLRCEVSFDGWNGEQNLVEPALVGMPARPVSDGDDPADTTGVATAEATSDVPTEEPAETGNTLTEP